MSEIKVSYEVTYDHDEIVQDMLDSGEYGLDGYPITDVAITYNVLDKFVGMEGTIPMIPGTLDRRGVLTVEDARGKVFYQFPGLNTLAEREDDHDSR